ncbi:MAG: hypothetical protein RL318_391 [Fibrobacterota bacterium]|jgi:hypothetical protein
MGGFARISGLDQSEVPSSLLLNLRWGSVVAIFLAFVHRSWKRNRLTREKPWRLAWPTALLYAVSASFLGFSIPPALAWLTLEWGGTIHRSKVIVTNLDAPSLDRGCRHPVRFRSLGTEVETKTCALPEAIRLQVAPGDTLDVRWITGGLGRLFDGATAIHPRERSDTSSLSDTPDR